MHFNWIQISVSIDLHIQHSIYVKQIFYYQKYKHGVPECLFGIVKTIITYAYNVDKRCYLTVKAVQIEAI